MKTVGIRQLKARLSEYIRLVKGGEVVLVTERDEVVAELRPARHAFAVSGERNDVLDRLEAAGELTRAAATKADWRWQAGGLGLPSGTAQRLLDELRGDRL